MVENKTVPAENVMLETTILAMSYFRKSLSLDKVNSCMVVKPCQSFKHLYIKQTKVVKVC